jgi:hypothetical protein
MFKFDAAWTDIDGWSWRPIVQHVFGKYPSLATDFALVNRGRFHRDFDIQDNGGISHFVEKK